MAEAPGSEWNSARSVETNVSAASLSAVRSVAAQTPPGQLKTAPTRLDGSPKPSRWGSAAPSAR